MKHKIFRLFLITLSLTYCNLFAVSMVYNFRIAQITKRFQFGNEGDKHWTLLGLFFDQWRKKPERLFQTFVGGFGSLIYGYESFYFRMDSAFSRITQKQKHTKPFCDVETDDILFSFGYNFLKNKSNLGTATLLTGVPTHQILRLKHVDFGYGQYSIGAQIDASHSFFSDYRYIFLYGFRYIKFFSRCAIDNTNKKHNFSIGNMVDIFIANKNNWEPHSLEYGYTAKFRIGAKVYPKFDEIIEKTNYIRSNFYAVYRYKFMIKDVSNKILVNLSYGFDHLPKKFGNKYIIMFWASWNVHF